MHLLRKAIEEYLVEKHCTLWGRAYDVRDPKSREQAIDFLFDTLQGIEERRRGLMEQEFMQAHVGVADVRPLRAVVDESGMAWELQRVDL